MRNIDLKNPTHDLLSSTWQWHSGKGRDRKKNVSFKRLWGLAKAWNLFEDSSDWWMDWRADSLQIWLANNPSKFKPDAWMLGCHMTASLGIALVEETALKYVLNANLFTDFIMATISRVRRLRIHFLVTSLTVRLTNKSDYCTRYTERIKNFGITRLRLKPTDCVRIVEF